jgi:hypothetical protein
LYTSTDNAIAAASAGVVACNSEGDATIVANVSGVTTTSMSRWGIRRAGELVDDHPRSHRRDGNRGEQSGDGTTVDVPATA